VRNALLSLVVDRQHLTFIWKSEDPKASAVAQLRWDEGCQSARLAFLAADGNVTDGEEAEVVEEDLWLPLLDELTAEAGKRGAHNLVAEVSETGPELPILRRAGFAVYTRQDIWICDQPVESPGPDLLSPRQSIDDWDILVLYSGIVPGLIQSVEPNPHLNQGRNWVLREDGELAAFIHIKNGPAAGWMRLLIHPNAHSKPREIIKAALFTNQPSSEHPVYCCVRRYQSWLQGPLEEAGFQLWGRQAVMVKHIAQKIEQPAPVLRTSLEAQTVPASVPLVQGFSQPNGKSQKKN
jgi:hypothetical protein